MGTTADNWNEGKLGHFVTGDSYFASEAGGHVQPARGYTLGAVLMVLLGA